jgi:hypothetical protein
MSGGQKTPFLHTIRIEVIPFFKYLFILSLTFIFLNVYIFLMVYFTNVLF